MPIVLHETSDLGGLKAVKNLLGTTNECLLCYHKRSDNVTNPSNHPNRIIRSANQNSHDAIEGFECDAGRTRKLVSHNGIAGLPVTPWFGARIALCGFHIVVGVISRLFHIEQRIVLNLENDFVSIESSKFYKQKTLQFEASKMKIQLEELRIQDKNLAVFLTRCSSSERKEVNSERTTVYQFLSNRKTSPSKSWNPKLTP